MARLPRLGVAAWPHLVVQGVHDGQSLARDDVDRALLLDTLREASRTHGVSIHAYCLAKGVAVALNPVPAADLFAAAQDLPEFLADMELSHIADLSLSEQADALCDASQGLVWFHAKSMRSFVTQCIHCTQADGDFWGFVVDEPGI